MRESSSHEPAMEVGDPAPDIGVSQAEYQRLLGYPPGFVLADRARELSESARQWYARHGRPWVYAREAATLALTDAAVAIDGVPFGSTRLLETLGAADAHSAIVVAVGAGPEIEDEAQQRWRDEKPDEYFFLEVYGSAVVEHLVTMTGARLCAWADSRGMAVLPHYSPGYPDWDIQEQGRLLDVIKRPAGGTIRIAVETLESGMLRPKKSLLAVFGVTRHVDRVRRLTELSPCDNCSFLPCQFRRAPYRRAPESFDRELPAVAPAAAAPHSAAHVLDRNARYSINIKALERWTNERLSIEPRADDTLEAVFRYDGTTCTNMGRPLRFLYHVTLGARADGYPIRQQGCTPAPDDDGYTYMCGYIRDSDHLMAAVGRERPLLGQRLNDVLNWSWPASPAGCYCDPESRQHKWGLVLQTLHYALAHRQENDS